jgi:hypothetical protein
MKVKNIYVCSLTALLASATCAVQAEQFVTAPTLEGGISASIGTWYATPSADAQDYGELDFTSDGVEREKILEVNPDYNWGLLASLGWIFDETANSVEVNYRWLNTNDNDATNAVGTEFIDSPFNEIHYTNATSELTYELSAVDLMFNQFMDLGEHVQMRFGAGASYVNLEKEQTSYYLDVDDSSHNSNSAVSSNYSGFGPRVSVDGRYDFGNGVGILGGGSLAYFVGDLDFKKFQNDQGALLELEDDLDSHGVTNLRANVAVDYVYFFDNDESTMGLELGYQFDYYDNIVHDITDAPGIVDSETLALSFSGPYLNLKGVF